MKTYHFLPVFLVLLASYIGIHLYAARWLVRSFSLAGPAAQWLKAAFLAAALLAPFAMFLRRQLGDHLLEPLYTAIYVWMGVILIAAFVFFCSDLLALLLRRAGWFRPLPFAAGTLAVLSAIIAWSLYSALRVPPLRQVSVAFKGLPPELEGLKIAQISDMHLDAEWKVRKLAAIIDEINAAKPDLVVFTGDLVDPGVTCGERLKDIAGRIKSRLGVYGALGNHEYYYGLGRAGDCYAHIGIKLLKDSAADAGPLRVIGLGDIHTAHMTRADVEAVLRRYKDGKFTVLLSHQPVFYRAIASAGDYLVLSGHTHRGQIFPFHIFTWLFYRHFYGLYRIGGSAFYVTSGAGTWGPPLRWLAPSEIPLITLKAG